MSGSIIAFILIAESATRYTEPPTAMAARTAAKIMFMSRSMLEPSPKARNIAPWRKNIDTSAVISARALAAE